MHPQDRLPRSARALILLVTAAGLAVVIVRSLDVSKWKGPDAIAWGALALGIALAEQFTLPIRYRTETLNCSLTEGLWIAALVLARPSVLALAVGAGVIVGHTFRRWAPYKAAFNVGQFLVALTAAQVVFRALHPHGATHPWTWLATGLAMATYAVVNAGLVALVISLVERRPILAVLLPPLPANAAHFCGNTVIGLGGAMLWSASPFVFPVVVVPLVLAFVIYRVLLKTAHQRDSAGIVSA
jgi:hypothetical protein